MELAANTNASSKSMREFTEATNLQGDLLSLSLMSSQKFVDEFEKRVEPFLLISHINVTKKCPSNWIKSLEGILCVFLHEVLSAINS